MVGAATQIDILNLLLVLVLAWIGGAMAERVGYPSMMCVPPDGVRRNELVYIRDSVEVKAD